MASEIKSPDAFEAALKREVGRASSSSSAECLAPEILAAYYDRTLTRAERARVDAHLTSCARCQSIMASIARADDNERPSTQPETSRGLFWLKRLAPPVALVGIMVALAIGLKTRQQRAPEQIALASPRAVARQIAPLGAAPPPLVRAPEALPEAANAPVPLAATAHHKSLASREKPHLAAKQSAPQEIAKATVAPPLVAYSTSTRMQSFESSGSAGQAAPMQRQPLAMQRPALGSGAGAVVSGATSAMVQGRPINQVSSPDGRVTWQFGGAGMVSRLGVSGAWLPMHSGVTTDLLAASAPSDDVCWIVGKSGTVVRTLDGGEHWQIARAPSSQDLTAITSSDSNNASVIAADGARFTTHDGGVTWSSP